MILSIPSSWGMFVYSDDTSMDTRMQSVGNLFDSIVLINEVESCMYDGSCLTYGCSQWSMNVDMFSVMLPQLETMGLIPCGFLWIFFRKYTLEVLRESGGQQKLNQDSVRKPPSFIDFSFEMIVSFRIGVGSCLSLVYIFLSFRCIIVFLMYSVLSSITIVFPLSALLLTICGLCVSLFNAFLSFLVRLSLLLCFRLHSFISFSLIFHSAVSSVLLTLKCSFSFHLYCLVMNGSLFVVLV